MSLILAVVVPSDKLKNREKGNRQGCIKLQDPRGVGVAEISNAGTTAVSTACGLEID
jgi:hypothetical protein